MEMVKFYISSFCFIIFAASFELTNQIMSLSWKIVEAEGILTTKQIDSAMKVLKECHDELLKIDSVARECEKLAKITEDGVSAGH